MFTSSISGLISIEAQYHAFTDTAGTVQATTDGQAVAAFKATGLNMVQATSGARPLLKLGLGYNGSPVLRFDGADDILTDTGIALGANYTVIAIGYSLARAVGNQVFFGAKGDSSNSYLKDAKLTSYSTAEKQGEVSGANYQALHGWIFGTSTVNYYVDDRVKTVTVSAGPSGTGLSLGGYASAKATLDVSHILIHPSSD